MNAPFVSLLLFLAILLPILTAEYRLYVWLFKPVPEHVNRGN